jgi:agmatinase
MSDATFAGLPAGRTAPEHGVAILGAAEASPYDPAKPSHAAPAPAAIRKASAQFAHQLEQFDFDLLRPLIGDKLARDRLADLGDVPTDPADAAGNRRRITDAVRAVLAAGSAPLVLGGDDSVPIPVFQAFEGHGPLTMVQVDAHVDWGDVIRGNPFGYGSPMRRAAEMPWITGMVQVGMRGLGSGTADQMEDARAWGSQLVTARQLRREGAEAALRHIPAGADCIVSIDCDGLDPTVLPAVNMPTPGGLDYGELAELLRGIAARARIRGCCLVELVPSRDPTGLSALVAARIALTATGLMAGAPA